MKFKKSCNIEVTNFSYVKALLRRKRGNGGVSMTCVNLIHRRFVLQRSFVNVYLREMNDLNVTTFFC